MSSNENESAQRLPEALRRALEERIARDGERSALLAIGISRIAAYRALAGLPVLAGTRALLQLGLGLNAATPPRAA